MTWLIIKLCFALLGIWLCCNGGRVIDKYEVEDLSLEGVMKITVGLFLFIGLGVSFIW